MEHGHPFARLAADVAAARARGRPTRLVVRHTERFGLVHLYFHNGRLAHVEGHLGSPVNSLHDLATWDQGVIRRDDDPGDFIQDNDPQLEMVFADVLRQLQARGVVQPEPPARVWPSRPGSGRRATPSRDSMASSYPSSQQTSSIGSGDLPPLSTVDDIERRVPPGPPSELRAATPPTPPAPPMSPKPQMPPEPSTPPTPQPSSAPQPRLTEPQWQLLALVIHQVVEKAGSLVGAQMAEGMLAQALQTAARSHAALTSLDIDALGWLKAREGDSMTRYPAFAVADAVATLLTGFELRVASLIGADQAQSMIASAAGPFRSALLQIGLDVAG